ncbi:MAG: heme-copper oxidase subunit III [Verrucomicrobia bacterium]|nr:heme-copper oxidase subunit III [Verrucomicrobiota bacterium]
MEIPYGVQERPDTGLWNAKLGMWLFLASEVMLFGGLFASYATLRTYAPDWPKGSDFQNIPLGTFNTAVLITSSITMVMGWASLVMGQFGKFRLYMGLTLLLGVLFLGIKATEYRGKFEHYGVTLADGTVVTGHVESQDASRVVLLPDAKGGAAHEPMTLARSQIKRMIVFGPWYNTYLALYFTLTGLHALHLLAGVLVNLYLWGPGSRMWQREPERFTHRVECAGLFWHFVDLVWIFLFPILYLL